MSLLDKTFILAVNSPVEVGVNLTNEVIMSMDGRIIHAVISAKQPPVGDSLIVDIKKNGKSVWHPNKYNRLRLNSDRKYGIQTKFDSVDFKQGDFLSIDVFQVGSEFPGQNITVQILVEYGE